MYMLVRKKNISTYSDYDDVRELWCRYIVTVLNNVHNCRRLPQRSTRVCKCIRCSLTRLSSFGIIRSNGYYQIMSRKKIILVSQRGVLKR